MKKLLSLIVFFLPLISTAQQANTSVAEGLHEVNQAYLKTASLRMNVNYVLFPSYTSTVPFESEKGVFMKQGRNTYSDLLGIVSLTNAGISLTIDSNEQTIVATDPPDNSMMNPSLVNIDSALRVCNSVTADPSGDQLMLYKLRFDNLSFSDYNAIDVYVNKQTHFIDRLILYFRTEVDLDETDNSKLKDRPRLEISYTSISTSPVFKSGQFSETPYIRISAKKMTCTPAYATYRLINNKLK